MASFACLDSCCVPGPMGSPSRANSTVLLRRFLMARVDRGRNDTVEGRRVGGRGCCSRRLGCASEAALTKAGWSVERCCSADSSGGLAMKASPRTRRGNTTEDNRSSPMLNQQQCPTAKGHRKASSAWRISHSLACVTAVGKCQFECGGIDALDNPRGPLCLRSAGSCCCHPGSHSMYPLFSFPGLLW